MKEVPVEARDADIPNETECESVWYSSGAVVWTYWGHALFETEYIEVMTICLTCGNGAEHSCTC